MNNKRNLNTTLSPDPDALSLVHMDHALAQSTQGMLQSFAMNYGLASVTPATAFVLPPQLHKDAKLTDTAARNHVSTTQSGKMLHAFLDANLQSNANPAVRRAALSLGDHFGGTATDAALVGKMQAAFGWTNAEQMGIKREEIRAIKALTPDELGTARAILDGSVKLEMVDPALLDKLSKDFPVKNGAKTEQSSILKAMDKIQNKGESPEVRSKAMPDIAAGHLVDGHYGKTTEAAWKSFIDGPGTKFASVPPTGHIGMAMADMPMNLPGQLGIKAATGAVIPEIKDIPHGQRIPGSKAAILPSGKFTMPGQ